MIKKVKTNESVKYQKLTPEEMKAKGILGRLAGVCADFINPTRNGRKYSEQLWENVFSNPLMQEKIENGVCYGELGHPADRTETDPEKIAICLRQQPVKNEKGQLIAVFDILDTPCGRILKTLCDYGSRLGISSRGQGDLITDYNGDESVDPDTYECECWDIVLTPGVKEARLDFLREGLENKTNANRLKVALRESLNEAEDKDKKVMEDTLKELDININEEDDSEEEVVETEEKVEDEVDSAEDDTSSEETEASDDEVSTEEDKEETDVSLDSELITDEDGKTLTITEFVEFVKENYDEDIQEKVQAILDEKREYDDKALEQIKDILDGKSTETDEEEVTDDIDVEDKVEETETEEEATDDGDEEVLEELKEALRAKQVAESEVRELKEKLAVSDTKVTELTESNESYKTAVERLTRIAKDRRVNEGKIEELNKELEAKNQTIDAQNKRLARLVQARKVVSEQCEDLKNKLSKKDGEVKTLTESFKSGNENDKKEAQKLQEEYKVKLTEASNQNKKLKENLDKESSLKESYKRLATQAANKYIEVKALTLGLTAKDIKRKLGESYSLEDVDVVCEDLKNYQVNLNTLPFNVGDRIRMRVNESKKVVGPNGARGKSSEDDDVSESLIHLANL